MTSRLTVPFRCSGDAYALQLLPVDRHTALVRLCGDFDLASTTDVHDVLDSVHLSQLTLLVDLSGVAFIDTTGIEPIVEAARRRQAGRLPPLLLGAISPVARRLLQLLNLGIGPTLDVAAWESTYKPQDQLVR